MSPARKPAPRIIKTVRTAARIPKRQIPLPITSPACSGRFSPIFCPTRIVIPMASPVISDVTVCMSWLPVETADTSVGAPNCPTTIRSTAPYMAWRNRAASTGRANLKSLERILPSVKSAVFSIVSSSLIFCIPPEVPDRNLPVT